MLKRPKYTNQTEEEWLNEAYEANKEMIDKVYGRVAGVVTGRITTKQSFIYDIKEHAEAYGFGDSFTALRKGFDKIAHEGDFMPAQERAIRNISGMKSNLGKNAFYDLQNLTREKGRFSKFDYNKMIWNRKEGVWIYDNRIVIDFRNSPLEVVLRVI